ncbi:MAG: response regulator, partial [Candidatus Obscuribacterales bacterium]|nr:response regulator [Candidatus Obscuribacterales bacterium]
MAKILIVEDDKGVAGILADVLDNEHHITDIAPSLSEARHFLKISRYDMILLDWELPDGSGVDLCRDLRRNGDSIPI